MLTDAESSSDSLCDTEAEVDNISDNMSPSDERPPKSKVSKRSIVNRNGQTIQVRKSRTLTDFKSKHPWLIIDSQKRLLQILSKIL